MSTTIAQVVARSAALNSCPSVPAKVLCCYLLLLLTASVSLAGSATWSINPINNDWNTAANWNPNTVPNKQTDTATFYLSSRTDVSLSDRTSINGIVFNPDGNAFTITTTSATGPLLMSGAGITNNSGLLQNFVANDGVTNDKGTIQFNGNATAGNLTAFTNNDADSNLIGGVTFFYEQSSAGSAVFINNKGGRTQFSGTATAANGTFTNNGGHTIFDGGSTAENGTFNNIAQTGAVGSTQFQGFATAGDGSFTNQGGTAAVPLGAFTTFYQHSNGGNGVFINNGGQASGASGGTIFFTDVAGASNGTYTNYGGAVAGAGGSLLQFLGTTTMDSATLIAYGGVNGGDGAVIEISNGTHGDRPRVEIFGNALLDISAHLRPLVTVGSLEGDGSVQLGRRTLAIGSNNLSTEFSGVIADNNQGGIRKIGSGTLILSGVNTYHSGTVVNRGKLLVNTQLSSGTGSGVVQVNDGALGGNGSIGGSVTVGSGTGAGASLSPGSSNLGLLTIQGSLTFNAQAACNWNFNSDSMTGAGASAKGITINSAAVFSGADRGGRSMPPGTTFTLLSNTATTAISGAFSNLPDGGTVTIGSNSFVADYQGGDGNDLTLTVVQ